MKFTQPVDETTAKDANNYKMRAWTYIWQASYGSLRWMKSFPRWKWPRSPLMAQS